MAYRNSVIYLEKRQAKNGKWYGRVGPDQWVEIEEEIVPTALPPSRFAAPTQPSAVAGLGAKPKKPGIGEIAKEAFGEVISPLETIAGLGTGAASWMASRIGGIPMGLLSGLNIREAREAADVAAGMTTYKPKTEKAQKVMETAGKIFELPYKGAEYLGKRGLVSPENMAWIETGIDFLMITGAPKISKAIKAKWTNIKAGMKSGKLPTQAEIKPLITELEKAITIKKGEVPGQRPITDIGEILKRAEAEKAEIEYLPIEKEAPPMPTVEPPPAPILPIERAVPGGPAAGSLTYGMELPAKRLGQTMAKWGENYELNKFILDTTDSLENQIAQRKRGVVTWEQTAADADALSMTPESLSKLRKGTALNDAQLYKAGQMTKLMTEEALRANKEYIANPTPENFQQQLLTLKAAQESLTVYQGAAGEAGRALNILRKTIDPSLRTQEVFNKFLQEHFGDPEKIDMLIRKFATIDQTDIKAVYKFLKETQKATTTEMIHEGWLSSIVSFPLTHIVNTAGNLSFATYAFTAEKALMAGVEFVKHPFKPSARQAFFGEIPQALFGLVDGLPEGIRRMAFAWQNELTAEGISKLEYRGKRIPGKAGKQIRGPLRALMAEDEFAKGAIYHSELSARAYAWAKREGLKGEALTKRIVELKENPPEGLKAEVRDTTLRLTFQEELGKIGKAATGLRQSIPGGHGIFVVPFIRTMCNIVKTGLERGFLPYSLPSAISKTIKAKKGLIPKIEATRARASVVSASMIPIGIAILRAKGMITGAPPEDPQERWLFYQNGYQPYSFIINEKPYPFGRIEPFASMLGPTIDIMDIIADLGKEDQVDLGDKLIWAFRQNFNNKTFMAGLVNLFNALSDPERYAGSFVKTLAGSAVPSAVAGTARAVDPYFREVKTFVDLYKSKIPFISKQVPPSITPMGQVKERPGTTISRFISPVQPTEIKKDIVMQELLRLGVNIGYPAKKIAGRELSREEHRRYTKIFGDIARPQLIPIFSDIEYRKLNDEEKLRLIKQIIDATRDYARAQLISEIQR